MLHRVVAQTDTRPATAAEICVALTSISLKVPLHGIPAGLYGRMWVAAFPHASTTAEMAQTQQPYEQLHSSQIDDLEQQLRNRLADDSRLLPAVTCIGIHNGAEVQCRYTKPAP
jgi:hypothetical protein